MDKGEDRLIFKQTERKMHPQEKTNNSIVSCLEYLMNRVALLRASVGITDNCGVGVNPWGWGVATPIFLDGKVVGVVGSL